MDAHRRQEIRLHAQRRMLEELSKMGRDERTEKNDPDAQYKRPAEQLRSEYEPMLRPPGDFRVKVYEKPEWGEMWAWDLARKLGVSLSDIRHRAQTGQRIQRMHVVHADVDLAAWEPPARVVRGSRPVYCTKDGTTVHQRFPTLSVAKRKMGFKSRTSVLLALENGHRAGGFFWRYADVPAEQQVPLHLDSTRPAARPVFSTDGSQRLQEFKSIADAARANGAKVDTLYMAILRGSRSHGFFWRYADIPEDQQPPLRMEPVQRPVFSTTDGQRVLRRFVSITDAIKAMGLAGRESIHRALREGRRAGGVFWRYSDVPLSDQPELRQATRERPVYSTDGKNVLRRFPGVKQAARAMGMKWTTQIIKAIRNGHRAGGVFWRYADIPESVQTPLRVTRKGRKLEVAA